MASYVKGRINSTVQLLYKRVTDITNDKFSETEQREST
jgi:hypothetical protein